ncbi:MAG: SMP-30/gluconolactonase/LRE family protein [Candidatus Latescibacteria bacterium]|nr:SMP-30/gluconolactonase/LRE family protein [Candidatus Latescibacterota bacterium]
MKTLKYGMRILFIFACSLGIFSYAALPDDDSEKNPQTNSAKYYTIIPRDAEPELVYDGSTEKPVLTFTEGPSWMNGALYFSNYYMFWKKWKTSDEGGLRVQYPDGTHKVLNKDVQTCGTIPLANGNIAVCDLIARAIVEMSPNGKFIRTLAAAYDGKKFGRPNDLVIDAKSGIYFTDPNNAPKDAEKQPGNAIYYITPQGEVTRVTGLDEFGFPNGCVLSPDGDTFYVNDAQSVHIWQFDVNEDGTLSNKRLFTEVILPEERRKQKNPRSDSDGMTIDTHGNVYVATPMGIQIFDRDGKSIGIVTFPQPPSNCIFGGDDMKTLYATCRDRIYSIRTNAIGMSYPPEK